MLRAGPVLTALTVTAAVAVVAGSTSASLGAAPTTVRSAVQAADVCATSTMGFEPAECRDTPARRGAMAAKPRPLGIFYGDAFADGISSAEYDKFTFKPGAMSKRKLLRDDSSLGNQDYRSYDFSRDLKKMYTVAGDTSSLIEMNQTFGEGLDTIGTMTKHSSSQSWTDITIDPVSGAAYAASGQASPYPSESTIYRLNLATGATTELATVPNLEIQDMSINCQGQMYGIDQLGDRLVRIDTATGAATPVGSLGVAIQYSQGIDFDNKTGVLHGWLYAGTGVTLYGSINLTSGAATPFPGASPAGEYEGAIKTACRSPQCPKLEKSLKKAEQALKAAKRTLKAAQQSHHQGAIANAKKALRKAQGKVDKAETKAEENGCDV